LDNFDVDFDFQLLMPPLAIKKTKLVKTLGVPTGVKIYFQFAVSVTFSLDVVCNACGKNTRIQSFPVSIKQTIYIPKKLSGLKLITKIAGSAIPGVNVIVLAQEIFESYQTVMSVKAQVQKLIAFVRFIRANGSLLRKGKFTDVIKNVVNKYLTKKGYKDEVDKLIKVVKLVRGLLKCKQGKFMNSPSSKRVLADLASTDDVTLNGEVDSDLVAQWNRELAEVIRQKLEAEGISVN
jgi:hypothetical protein